ncbi:TPA: hypothetical protein DIU27_02760 [Candidatus Collierbacteria bacterium]|uniref:Uncharacterized protein n=1 Tax=Candidatus Collierbacteria bacterium GW2011_GWB2_44_22 TaxID=1618387 RepID=A0A0G1KWA3_9BACT|nr:MAG: hypothetical protein UW31_C0001G0049 [Candidatus Collierbacteria bacterium GW2011_GWA2_44_13]KKT52184.1 MAG: hypothetical protein UW44_C0003G0027 [Candidatus Collierbacteria bacterium GW2011_GWB2_44_22]KKT62348.1 MAG: hypothetical protein UW56_C0008G0027 [Candidatus Collierbacteria bacterium GW2011_GWD1_44_27]KKT65897.1 MAG: hypothetical protein UW58_C0017G0029 [Candidatus Collierbacteria bacterium GW2011_GWC2_44_30]KKT68638.1 MAG: hypothetical protein UW64_C0014G0027 [Microgenomates gr
MSNFKINITNPEAIKLINDIKSGVVFVPIKTWVIRYKWFFVSGLVIIVLLIALAIGKAISGRSKPPVFLPPDIGAPVPTVQKTVKSDYEWIRENIQNFSTDLPDPVIPPFDNAIDLESVNI